MKMDAIVGIIGFLIVVGLIVMSNLKHGKFKAEQEAAINSITDKINALKNQLQDAVNGKLK
jgi:sensor domain CHASE-containing protein